MGCKHAMKNDEVISDNNAANAFQVIARRKNSYKANHMKDWKKRTQFKTYENISITASKSLCNNNKQNCITKRGSLGK